MSFAQGLARSPLGNLPQLLMQREQFQLARESRKAAKDNQAAYADIMAAGGSPLEKYSKLVNEAMMRGDSANANLASNMWTQAARQKDYKDAQQEKMDKNFMRRFYAIMGDNIDNNTVRNMNDMVRANPGSVSRALGLNEWQTPVGMRMGTSPEGKRLLTVMIKNAKTGTTGPMTKHGSNMPEDPAFAVPVENFKSMIGDFLGVQREATGAHWRLLPNGDMYNQRTGEIQKGAGTGPPTEMKPDWRLLANGDMYNQRTGEIKKGAGTGPEMKPDWRLLANGDMYNQRTGEIKKGAGTGPEMKPEYTVKDINQIGQQIISGGGAGVLPGKDRMFKAVVLNIGYAGKDKGLPFADTSRAMHNAAHILSNRDHPIHKRLRDASSVAEQNAVYRDLNALVFGGQREIAKEAATSQMSKRKADTASTVNRDKMPGKPEEKAKSSRLRKDMEAYRRMYERNLNAAGAGLGSLR